MLTHIGITGRSIPKSVPVGTSSAGTPNPPAPRQIDPAWDLAAAVSIASRASPDTIGNTWLSDTTIRTCTSALLRMRCASGAAPSRLTLGLSTSDAVRQLVRRAFAERFGVAPKKATRR